MAKELSIEEMRFITFNGIIELCKNINKDGMVYLTKDLAMSVCGYCKDEFYNGSMFYECDTSSLYISEGVYYKLNATDISRAIKADKIKKVIIDGNKLLLANNNDEVKLEIKPIKSSSSKFNRFMFEYNKYVSKLSDDIELIDITDSALDALKSNLPLLITFPDGNTIRFTKAMCRTKYTEKNLISVRCGIKLINEQLYILHLLIEKQINTKVNGTLQHAYAVVPF